MMECVIKVLLLTNSYLFLCATQPLTHILIWKVDLKTSGSHCTYRNYQKVRGCRGLTWLTFYRPCCHHERKTI